MENINIKTVKAFLFDLDGVLIDSESEYTKIWETIEKKFPTGIENFAIKIKGTTLEDILSTYFPDSSMREEVEKELYRLESEMVYKYSRGAKRLLDILAKRQVPMVLVTSSNSDKMSHLYCDIPEIKNYFKTVIVGEMVKNSKPAPDGYLMAAKALNVLPEDCIVVEDSLQGIRAGKRAGAFVVGVAGTLPSSSIESEADLVVENIEQLAVLLENE